MFFGKRSCLHFPRPATNQQTVKKGSLLSRIRPVTKSSLNLPSLVKSQKLKRCDKMDEINEVFLKLSMLYNNLPDPLRDILLQCACEDQQKCYKVSYFDNFSMNLIPKEAYCSPPPSHMPLSKRRVSNQIANQPRPLGVYRQDMPLATIIARWIPKTMSFQYDQQSTIQELANFGDIESLIPCGRQTVIVTFKEIRSACKAMVNSCPSTSQVKSRKKFICCLATFFWASLYFPSCELMMALEMYKIFQSYNIPKEAHIAPRTKHLLQVVSFQVYSLF
ncbi:testis expressed protein 56-like isoform X1 [Pantherophis guttatus]|uniref:Testis expressed protein 56-like isoform X1 n=1 Tax=Pantherophis guttatus TaxID=94885 RepID=A0A6P9CZT9_PANGU|nr:testis expressed protein 56-like isoform X1 [Pantherophis guttatus]